MFYYWLYSYAWAVGPRSWQFRRLSPQKDKWRVKYKPVGGTWPLGPRHSTGTTRLQLQRSQHRHSLEERLLCQTGDFNAKKLWASNEICPGNTWQNLIEEEIELAQCLSVLIQHMRARRRQHRLNENYWCSCDEHSGFKGHVTSQECAPYVTKRAKSASTTKTTKPNQILGKKTFSKYESILCVDRYETWHLQWGQMKLK